MRTPIWSNVIPKARRKKLKLFYCILLFSIIIYVTLWKWNVTISCQINILPDSVKIDIFMNTYWAQSASSTCTQRNVYLVILVPSYVSHVRLRNAHRRAMPVELLRTLNATRVFLLARIPATEKKVTQAALNVEIKEFGDILQGSFVEHFRNLSFKILMGLEWATSACASASFILKVDDDMVFRLDKTYEILSQWNSSVGLLGNKMYSNYPRRNASRPKYYIAPAEYSGERYPTYMSGWYYIATMKAATLLTAEARRHRYFPMEDVFITGILARVLNMNTQQIPKRYWAHRHENVNCCLEFMVKSNKQCDYAVGPSSGHNNDFIVKFTTAVEQCKTKKNCTTLHFNNTFPCSHPKKSLKKKVKKANKPTHKVSTSNSKRSNSNST